MAEKTSPEVSQLLACATDGERRQVLGQLITQHLRRLKVAVSLHLDHQLAKRVTVDDVLQDTSVDALERLDEYLRNPGMSFYLWLRFLAIQKIKALYRHHVAAKCRDPRREIARRGSLDASDSSVDAPAVAPLESPSQVLMATEKRSRFREAMDSLPPLDREVIILRDFEQLPWAEAAQAFRMGEPALRQRHSRAMRKLEEALRRLDRSEFWR